MQIKNAHLIRRNFGVDKFVVVFILRIKNVVPIIKSVTRKNMVIFLQILADFIASNYRDYVFAIKLRQIFPLIRHIWPQNTTHYKFFIPVDHDSLEIIFVFY